MAGRKRSGPRRKLSEHIKTIKSRDLEEVSDLSVEMTLRAIEFVKGYDGDNPFLRSMHSRQSRIPGWVPRPETVAKIHAIAHRMDMDLERSAQRDALGNRLRAMEGEDVPDALADPDDL